MTTETKHTPDPEWDALHCTCQSMDPSSSNHNDGCSLAIIRELAAALRSAQNLLSAFEGISRNNFANLCLEEIASIDTALAKVQS